MFEDVVIDRTDLSEPWYRALNPAGVVPTLVDGDDAIIESSVILNYIEDAYPTRPALRSAGALARARTNLWLRVVDDLLVDLGTMTYAIFSRYRYLAQDRAARDAYCGGIADPYLRQSRCDAIELGLEAPAVAGALARLAGLQARAERDLVTGPYLCDEFGLADIALAPFIWRIEALGLFDAEPLQGRFGEWWVAIQARPSFRAGVVGAASPDMTVRLRQAARDHAAQLAALRIS